MRTSPLTKRVRPTSLRQTWYRNYTGHDALLSTRGAGPIREVILYKLFA